MHLINTLSTLFLLTWEPESDLSAYEQPLELEFASNLQNFPLPASRYRYGIEVIAILPYSALEFKKNLGFVCYLSVFRSIFVILPVYIRPDFIARTGHIVLTIAIPVKPTSCTCSLIIYSWLFVRYSFRPFPHKQEPKNIKPRVLLAVYSKSTPQTSLSINTAGAYTE